MKAKVMDGYGAPTSLLPPLARDASYSARRSSEAITFTDDRVGVPARPAIRRSDGRAPSTGAHGTVSSNEPVCAVTWTGYVSLGAWCPMDNGLEDLVRFTRATILIASHRNQPVG